MGKNADISIQASSGTSESGKVVCVKQPGTFDDAGQKGLICMQEH